MKISTTDSKVYPAVMTAMMMCIIMVSILLFRIPIPFTQGYVNLSDAMVFISVIILGYRYGAVAAGLGSMLGDLMAGFAMWAPWSLGIKGAMAIIFGLLIQSASNHVGSVGTSHRSISERGFISIQVIGMIIAGMVMTAGYYAAEGIMYGNWAVAALGIPWNIAQFALGIVVALAIATSLSKTSMRNMMAYTTGK